MYVGSQGNDRQERADVENSSRGIQAEGEPDADPIEYSEVGSLSGINEYEPQRVDRTLGKGDRGEPRTPDIGKMLRQLRQIREAHLAYVEAHGQRLEARLKENREHHQKILQEIADLETDLTKLLEEVEEEEPSS